MLQINLRNLSRRPVSRATPNSLNTADGILELHMSAGPLCGSLKPSFAQVAFLLFDAHYIPVAIATKAPITKTAQSNCLIE